MAYSIHYAADAVADMRRPHMSARDEAVVRTQARQLLADQPAVESTRRRRMAPNPLDATWELRLGELRAYYDIDESTATVWILRVGYKRRERVIVRGVQVDLREQP